jgi:2-dehydro-3-deoxyphosphogluconate aldolase/(4S)-4-hydroxy-2-oxoglutarate aldolase
VRLGPVLGQEARLGPVEVEHARLMAVPPRSMPSARIVATAYDVPGMAVEQAVRAAERLRRSAVAETIRRERAVAIMRRLDPGLVDPTVEALLAGGFAAIEFTCDSQDALGAIARWRGRERSLVGAGTVRRVDEVDPAVDAGAQFLVAPNYDPAVVERALELGVPCIPGCLSPTEIDSAWRQGATFVKLFPGAAVGPGYLKAVLAPLQEVEILVTGGVDASGARAFLDAGAAGVGVSTAQLGQPLSPDGDFGALERAARDLLAAVR